MGITLYLYLEGKSKDRWHGLFHQWIDTGYWRISYEILVPGAGEIRDINSIASKRGFPNDMSLEFKEEFEPMYGDLSEPRGPMIEPHTRSYLLLDEILTYDWNKKINSLHNNEILTARKAMGDEFWKLIEISKELSKDYLNMRFIIWFES